MARIAPGVGHNVRVTSTTGGKRAGSRRGARPKKRFQPALLLLALGITACVVAWGYLVYAAVDFGQAARGGDSTAWWFLGLAALGAVACLFVGLMLVAATMRRLGITDPPPPKTSTATTTDTKAEQPRPIGGRRAVR